jgi:hypothetical protein
VSLQLLEPGPAALAAVVFLVLTAWCFSHRRVDRSLAALGLYLGLLDGYLKLRTGSQYMTLARDVLVIAIAGGALLRSMISHKRLPLPPLGALVLAFGAVVVVEIFNPLGRPPAGALAGVRQHLEFVPLFFLGYAFVRHRSQLQGLLVILVICASVGGIFSYIQSTLTPEQFATWGPGYAERVLGTGAFAEGPRVAYTGTGVERVRPFGLGSDLGAGAVIAAMGLPALVALMMGARGALRMAMFPLAIGIALAVATSGTRAGLIIAFVSGTSFALLAATSRNAMRVIAGLAVGAILVYAAFGVLGSENDTARRAQSIAPTEAFSTFSRERGASVLVFGTYAVQYPLGIGVGSVGPASSAFGRRSETSRSFDSETQWNFLLLETGLVGFALIVAMNLRLMWVSWTRIRHMRDSVVRLQIAALAAPLFGLLAAGFAGPTTASSPQAPYFWLVAGILSYWLITAYREPQTVFAEEPSSHALEPPRARERGAREPASAAR